MFRSTRWRGERVWETRRASRSELLGAQTGAYGRAFFVIGLICFAGALFAVFLRSGKPAPGAGPAMGR